MRAKRAMNKSLHTTDHIDPFSDEKKTGSNTWYHIKGFLCNYPSCLVFFYPKSRSVVELTVSHLMYSWAPEFVLVF